MPIPYLKTLLKILIPTASVLTLFAGLLGMINANAILLQSMAKEGLFKGGQLLTPMTALGRPWITLVLQGIIVFILATILPSLPVVGGLTIFGVFLSFILPFVSLLVVQKRRNQRAKLPITIIGLLAVLGFCAYSWFTLSLIMSERIIRTVIIAGAFILGMLLFNKEKKSQ